MALLLMAVLAACGDSNGQRQVVTFWVMGYEAEVVAQLIPEFERQNPDISVDLQPLPWLSAHEKLLTAFAGDALPDVVPLGNTWIAEFEALGALQPLDDYVASAADFNQPDFFPGVWDSGVVNGQVYAVPWYVETRLPFYRTDLLAEAGIDKVPVDWEQWREAMAKVKQQVGPDRYAILLPLNEYEQLLSLALQQPEPMLRDGGRYGNFRSDSFKRALAFYREMFERKWAPVLTNNQISNVWDEFGHGLYAYYVSGPWNISKFKERLPADQQGDWMTMPLPGPDGPGASLANGTSFVIFRQSPRKQAAWKLIRYLSSPEAEIKLHALTGNLPPRRSPWGDVSLANDRYAAAFRDQLERAIPTPKVPEWERIASEVKLVAEQVANDRLSVAQAAEELDRRADRILEKRRWMLDHETATPAAAGEGARQ
ncbi:sugar ABC transporter substrate-binding protein [Pseudoxanthomonas dokdonensis]|uniref:ABC transporter substrate-binding protein n=1 Tax=Pseudoxanthomonas dokdonensis TaxID=344882 RepID=A0A0R0CTW7_9GAMM|nr:ABC transporter substrate-binding protein [Pseudoxanthomonas dokdonensis]